MKIRDKSWLDSNTFGRDKHVVVTGGAGFLDSFVVEKLQTHDAAGIITPRSEDCDRRDLDAWEMREKEFGR